MANEINVHDELSKQGLMANTIDPRDNHPEVLPFEVEAQDFDADRGQSELAKETKLGIVGGKNLLRVGIALGLLLTALAIYLVISKGNKAEESKKAAQASKATLNDAPRRNFAAEYDAQPPGIDPNTANVNDPMATGAAVDPQTGQPLDSTTTSTTTTSASGKPATVQNHTPEPAPAPPEPYSPPRSSVTRVPEPEQPEQQRAQRQSASAIQPSVSVTEKQPTAAELRLQRQLSSGFGNSGSSGSNGSSSGGSSGSNSSGNGGSDGNQGMQLADQLKPMRADAVTAGTLGNRDLLLTKGAMIPCVLETRIDSTVPGMTTCTVIRNVYSANMRTVLIDRGSKIIGEYQQGLQDGQNRLFVLWTRVETPKGVIINVDSAGTDALGGSGMDGRLNTHFFRRFGGAILVSLINDAVNYQDRANQRNQTGDNSQITYNETTSSATEIVRAEVQQTAKIRPSLTKNQGDIINIHIARDLDFSPVYSYQIR